MYISSLHLQQFRSYQDATFTFDPGITVIVGPNGSGKTNILEALYISCLGKSFRDPDDMLVMHGADWWRIETIVNKETRDVRYKNSTKTMHIHGKSYKRLTPQTRIPVVLFEPDHLMLIHGSPSQRRSYIDKQLAQLIPGYQTTLKRYERVISQRNRLLKNQQIDKDQLFVWDVSLAELATQITSARVRLVDSWNTILSERYSHISGGNDTVHVKYSSHPEHYTQRLLEALQHDFRRDLMLGTTTNGPHRDDVMFYLNEDDMVYNASRGEIRTLLLSLKYHEQQELEKVYHQQPILLFDDVFGELDESRQRKLLKSTSTSQVIISTTHTSHKSQSKIIKLK